MDLIVTVPDERAAFVKKLLRELNLAVKTAPAKPAKPRVMNVEQQEWVDEFREALNEVELHQQGKIDLQTLDKLIDELQYNPDR